MDMYDNYSPRDAIRRPFSNPIFRHELNRLYWRPEFDDIRGADWKHVWAIFGLQLVVVILIGVCGGVLQTINPIFGTALNVLLAIIVLIVPLAATVIVDLYTVSATVTFWHTHTQADTIDVLRLSVPTDDDLLTTLRSAAELVVWRAMRWEMALRSFLSISGIALGTVGGIVLLLALISTNNTDASRGSSLFALLWLAWIFRMLMLYLREPLWRMRALVAVSITIADRTSETNMAVLLASAAALGLKVVQIVVVFSLFLISDRVMKVQGGFLSSTALTIIWLIASGLFLHRLIRTAYGRLLAWCTQLSLRSWLGIHDTLLDTLYLNSRYLKRKSTLSTSYEP